MQYNSNATSQDIVSDVKFWTGIPSADTTTFPIADITRGANEALKRISSLIMRYDAKWEWDDSNNSDLPIATTTLVVSQHDYSIATTHLKILRVRVKDANGDYYTLDAKDRPELSDAELIEDDGQPRCYDKLGNSIFIYPAPKSGTVTLAAGLEVQFQRGANLFITTDTTKEPGFDSRFHRLVPLYTALDYTEANGLVQRTARIRERIQGMEQELIRAMTERSADEKVVLRPRGINFR